MNNLLHSGLKQTLKTTLLRMEKMAPQLTSRAWGILEKPMAEIHGLRITKLTEFHAEVTKAPWQIWFEMGSGDFLASGELAVRTLWKRHTLQNETVKLKKCSCEFLTSDLPAQFVARTELVENDRESILARGRMDGKKEFEATVLFFGAADRLIAQGQYVFVFESVNMSKLTRGES